MKKSNMDELNFLWEKTALHFLYDLELYNRSNYNSLRNLRSAKR